MMRGSGWTLGGMGLVVLLSGCPGDAAPGITTAAGSGSTGDRPGITTFNSTVDPTLPGSDSLEGGSMDGMPATEGSTSMGFATEGTTSVGSATDPGTTSGPGATTSGSTGPGTTEPGSSSGPGMTTDPGTTTGVGMTTSGGTTSGGTTSGGTSSGGGSSSSGPGCNDVAGNYENCLGPGGVTDTTPCMAPFESTCLIAGGMPPTAGVCSTTDCVDPCDCPAAPPSGDAVVSCADVTGGPDLFCYLDCSMGETCPTGMICFAGYLCIWPDPGAVGEPYGDCFNNDTSICGLDGLCLNDDVMMPTIGVCTTDCMNVGDCPAVPPGGASPAQCTDVTGDGMNECTIDCSGGTACPTGMTCFGGFICAWN